MSPATTAVAHVRAIIHSESFRRHGFSATGPMSGGKPNGYEGGRGRSDSGCSVGGRSSSASSSGAGSSNLDSGSSNDGRDGVCSQDDYGGKGSGGRYTRGPNHKTGHDPNRRRTSNCPQLRPRTTATTDRDAPIVPAPSPCMVSVNASIVASHAPQTATHCAAVSTTAPRSPLGSGPPFNTRSALHSPMRLPGRPAVNETSPWFPAPTLSTPLDSRLEAG